MALKEKSKIGARSIVLGLLTFSCFLTLFNDCHAESNPQHQSDFLEHFIPMNISKLSGKILFSSKIRNYERIFLFDLDAKTLSDTVLAPGNNSNPNFSMDATKFVFVSDRDGNNQIYLFDLASKSISRIAHSASVDEYPSWAPDNKRLVFQRRSKERNTNLYTIDSDGKNPIQVTNKKGQDLFPKWSPDGRLISYSTNRYWPGWDICVWDLSKHTESCPIGGRGSFFRASWSHSGNFLAYSKGSKNVVDLEIYDIRNQKTSRLTELPGKEYDATWSPNDQYIAFAADNGGSDDLFGLYVVEVGSGKVTQILDSSFPIRYPSWGK